MILLLRRERDVACCRRASRCAPTLSRASARDAGLGSRGSSVGHTQPAPWDMLEFLEDEVVDVQYARLRHVRPVPGDQLGRVTVQKEKVLQIRRDSEVLADWSRD